jgi:tetratricopeptide (TPR) repeat protein
LVSCKAGLALVDFDDCRVLRNVALPKTGMRFCGGAGRDQVLLHADDGTSLVLDQAVEQKLRFAAAMADVSVESTVPPRLWQRALWLSAIGEDDLAADAIADLVGREPSSIEALEAARICARASRPKLGFDILTAVGGTSGDPICNCWRRWFAREAERVETTGRFRERVSQAEAAVARGKAQIKNDAAAALQTFTAALTSLPTFAPAYYERAALLCDEQRPADALLDVDTALELNAGKLPQRVLDGLGADEREQPPTIVPLGDRARLAIFVRGQCLFYLDRSAEAIEAYSSLLNDVVSRDSQLIRLWRGMAYQDVKEWKKSIDDLHACLPIRADDAYVAFRLGLAHARLGEFENAVEDLTRSRKLDGKDDRASRELVNVYRARGEWDKAKYLAKESVRAEPQDSVAWNALGLVYYDEGHLAEALANFEHALANGGDIAVRANRAQTLARMERWDEASAEFDRLLSANSTPDDYRQRGHYMIRRGRATDVEAAIRDFRRALESDPSDARAHYDLAWALEVSGSPAEAAVEFEHALSTANDALGNQTVRALAFARLGRLDEAVDLLQRRREQAPFQPSLDVVEAMAYAMQTVTSQKDVVGKALDALQAAVDHGFCDRAALKWSPELQSLRENPRFQQLLDSIQGK